MTKVEKINRLERKTAERLDTIQRRCTARLLEMDDIKEMIGTAQKRLAEVLKMPVEKKYIKKIYITREFAVPHAYGYRAETTQAEVSITRHGKINIGVWRVNASQKPYGGMVQDIQEVYA